MRQYTTHNQTAKLIELGFEEPKSIGDGVEEILKVIAPLGNFEIPINNNCPDYSIGELISFLPPLINSTKFGTATINIFHDVINWVVGYDDVNGVMRMITVDLELIDALCTMCRKLKEEGVI